MPYIEKYRREEIVSESNINIDSIASWGELNFAITYMINRFIKNSDINLNYSFINSIIGVLECAKTEFYRRIAAPYEDKKIQENSDVY